MKKKIIVAALLLMAAGLQSAKAQTMTVNLVGGQPVKYKVSQVESVTFTEGEETGAYEWVDLGLASGTLWATCNIGASSPEDFGDYFAWGETAPKEKYWWDTYVYCKGTMKSITKYCNYYEYGNGGFTDKLTELEPADDAAAVIWGSEWQMPSPEQLEELLDNGNTDVTQTTQNGVWGTLITSKKNGSTIFLPATGYYLDRYLQETGSTGHYWLRSLYTRGLNPSLGCCLYFDEPTGCSSTGDTRHTGMTIRPVRVEKNAHNFVTGIALSQTSLSLLPDEMKRLTATVEPADADDTAVTWESSDEAVAVVVAGGIVLGVAPGTCTVTAKAADGGGAKAECQVTVIAHEYVDLGLPSGTLWATCNVGASKSEEGGDRFAWGETEPKDESLYGGDKWESYIFYTGKEYFSGYPDENYYVVQFSKYNMFSASGPIDNKLELEPEDDAATVHWGSEWQTPSNAQLDELRDDRFTICVYTEVGDVSGVRVISKINGESIFLPFADSYGYSKTKHRFDNTPAYWSRTLERRFYRIMMNEEPSSENAEYASVHSGGIGMSIVDRNRGLCVRPVRVKEDNHTYVDLGLPSGTLWATCNVGANSLEEAGDYFAWGDIEPKNCYNWSNYYYCNGTSMTLTKYSDDENYGKPDYDYYENILVITDDAAAINWSSRWEMPDYSQMKELIDARYTTITATTRNGVNGRLITSKSNGNSIFLPAAGFKMDYSLQNDGTAGCYWTSEYVYGSPDKADYLFFQSDNISIPKAERCYGLCIRPVRATKARFHIVF